LGIDVGGITRSEYSVGNKSLSGKWRERTSKGNCNARSEPTKTGIFISVSNKDYVNYGYLNPSMTITGQHPCDDQNRELTKSDQYLQKQWRS